MRPFSDVEVEARCRVATTKPPGEPQITLGQNKSFTFDEVYFMDSEQAPIFAETVQPLIDGSVSLLYCYLENKNYWDGHGRCDLTPHRSLEGRNATILAYGQVRACIWFLPPYPHIL